MISNNIKNVLQTKNIRFLSYCIDLFFRTGILVLILYILKGKGLFSDYFFIKIYALIFIIEFLYYSVSELAFTTSLGKIITNSKLVNYNLRKPKIEQIIVRNLSRMLPFEILFFFSHQNGYGWHDKLSKTLVISNEKLKEREAINEIDTIGINNKK